MITKIGGEFEMNPDLIKSCEGLVKNNMCSLFSSGRSALMAILETINININAKPLIYLPYYICSSVVEACKNQKFNIEFYELDENFLFNIDYLDNIKKNSSLLTVNYFGFVNNNNLIENIKNRRPDIITICDNVPSFWQCNNSKANFSFTSLRKFIPTPDGAIVYSKGVIYKPEKSVPENKFYKSKLLGSIAKYKKEKDNVYLNYFTEGEKILNKEKKITRASRFSEYFFHNYNLQNLKNIRDNNYLKVYEIGSKIGLNFVFPFLKGISPLCVPIFLENRDEIRNKLFDKNIFLPIYWPIEDHNKSSKLSNKMAKHELSIIIDHRYSLNEINHQLCEIKKHL